MKRTYVKPTIAVETLALDQPIAAGNCEISKEDMELLKTLNCFTQEMNCRVYIMVGGGVDTDNNGEADSYLTVCYHSNVQQAFNS